MKITKTRLRTIIKEELEAVIREAMDEEGKNNLSTLYIIPPNYDGPAKPFAYIANLNKDKMGHLNRLSGQWVPSNALTTHIKNHISDPEAQAEFEAAAKQLRLSFVTDFQPSGKPDLEVIDAEMIGVTSVDSLPQGNQRSNIPDSSNRGDI